MSNQRSRLVKIEKNIEPYILKEDPPQCIIIVKPDATDEEIEAEADRVRKLGGGNRSGQGPEFIIIRDYHSIDTPPIMPITNEKS
jgi:hypothetical protein